MKPLPFVWPGGLAFWIAYAWAFAAEWPFVGRTWRSQRGPEARDRADRGSMHAVIWSAAIGMWLTFAFAFALPKARIHAAMAAYVAGIVLVIAGGRLRRHCFRMLGTSFTYDVRVSAQQAVVERGAYRLVRHPSYTAGLLMFGGIGLALGNWASFAMSIAGPALGYAYRIRVEERALLRTLGPAYADYMTRTRRLIPFVL